MPSILLNKLYILSILYFIFFALKIFLINILKIKNDQLKVILKILNFIILKIYQITFLKRKNFI